ncbi:MAG: hypothetical protein PWP31_461 [Clostridia bacterium]|nr:hypothetical protein [Clostridia bacterium]
MTLGDFNAVLINTLDTPNKHLQEFLDHIIKGGKGLRPKLVLLCAQYGIHNKIEAQQVAAAIELIHLASLVHDDILDGANIRRNHPALHHLCGTIPAVLVGDYLFATAFNLLSKDKNKILNEVTKAIRSMCTGEIEQLMEGSSNTVSDLKSYYRYIGQKTAILISTACRCGSMVGCLKQSHQDLLALFGWHLGLAYQIIDDFLDLYGTSEEIGKSCYQDLRQGLLTLPVLRFLELTKKTSNWKEKIRRGLSQVEIKKLIGETKKLRCDHYTLEIAQNHISEALSALEKLPFNPVKDELAMIVKKISKPVENYSTCNLDLLDNTV